MALKYRNQISDLSNEQLINLLKTNNYHFEEILTKQAITGKQFLELREIDFVRWKLSFPEKKALWNCVTKLKNSPQNFFLKSPIELKKKPTKNTFENNEINKILEQVILAPDLRHNKPKLPPRNKNVVPPMPPDYTTMVGGKLSDVDDEFYLLPTPGKGNVEKGVWKPTPLFQHSPIYENKPTNVEDEDTYEEIEEKKSITQKSGNQFQSRALPNIPEIRYSDQDDKSSSSKGFYANENTKQEMFIPFCNTLPVKKSDSSSSLASTRSGGSTETLNVINKFVPGYDVWSVPKSSPKLPLPPNTLPTGVLKLSDFLSKYTDNEELEPENVQDEPYFRNTDRKGAKLLLHDLPDGAFLLRKNKKFYIVLTLKYNSSYINLGIEKRSDGTLKLIGEDDSSPDFTRLSQLVDHFTEHLLGFALGSGEYGQTLLKKVLPLDRF